MEIKIPRAELKDKLKILSDVASSPLVACQLKLSSSEIMAVDTGRNMGLVSKLSQAPTEGAEDILLPAKLLSSLVAQGSGEHVSFALGEGNEIALSDETSRYSLRAISVVTPFPAEDDFSHLFATMKAEELRQALQNVLYAASRKDARPILTGVSFKRAADGKVLELCATDAYRLAVSKVPAVFSEEEGEEVVQQIIVPTEAVQILLKVLEEAAEDEEVLIKLNVASGQAYCATAQWRLATRLLQGTYPPYEKLFPSEESMQYRAELNVAELSAALKRMKPLVPPINDHICLSFGEAISLLVENKDLGKTEEELKSSKVTSEAQPDFSVSLRYPHLLNVMHEAQADELTLCLQGEGKPVVLLDGESKALIMPA